MVKSKNKIVSFVLAILMILGMFTALSTTTSLSASAASGDVIYLELPSGWNSANAYVWSSSSDAAAQWPGTAMTKVSGETNVYSYQIPGSQSKIIFNDGNGNQTVDLSIEAGKIFKMSGGTTGNKIEGAWSNYSGATAPTNPPTPTNPTTPTNPGGTVNPPVTGSGTYAYLNNAANWGNPTVYYWKDKNSVGAWPGKKLTDADKDQMGNYQVLIPDDKVYGVIFSDGGNSQSSDLMISAGDCKIYNNSTSKWEEYDTSAVKFLSVGADVQSPQFKDTEIMLSANAAGGEGAISYKFSVKDSSGAVTVISDYSTTVKNAMWKPTAVGNYTVTIEVKDEASNTNKRDFIYEIKDDATAVEPVLKSITPSNGNEIKLNNQATVNVNASGGKVGTNLLFYKVAITDPDAVAVNTVYYKTSNRLNFTPTKIGTYTIDVSVQNSDNTTVNKVYTYECVNSITPTPTPLVSTLTADKTSPVPENTAITFTATGAQGTNPYQYQFSINNQIFRNYSSSNTFVWTPQVAGTYSVKVTLKDANNLTATKTVSFTITESAPEIISGDIDLDGRVTLYDLLALQYYFAQQMELSDVQKEAGTVCGNTGDPNLRDLLSIQQYMASIISSLD